MSIKPVELYDYFIKNPNKTLDELAVQFKSTTTEISTTLTKEFKRRSEARANEKTTV